MLVFIPLSTRKHLTRYSGQNIVYMIDVAANRGLSTLIDFRGRCIAALTAYSQQLQCEDVDAAPFHHRHGRSATAEPY